MDDREALLTAPELREALRQTRETLREVVGEFVLLDPARDQWHAPGLVPGWQMRDWRAVAGLKDEETTDEA